MMTTKIEKATADFNLTTSEGCVDSIVYGFNVIGVGYGIADNGFVAYLQIEGNTVSTLILDLKLAGCPMKPQTIRNRCSGLVTKGLLPKTSNAGRPAKAKAEESAEAITEAVIEVIDVESRSLPNPDHVWRGLVLTGKTRPERDRQREGFIDQMLEQKDKQIRRLEAFPKADVAPPVTDAERDELLKKANSATNEYFAQLDVVADLKVQNGVLQLENVELEKAVKELKEEIEAMKAEAKAITQKVTGRKVAKSFPKGEVSLSAAPKPSSRKSQLQLFS